MYLTPDDVEPTRADRRVSLKYEDSAPTSLRTVLGPLTGHPWLTVKTVDSPAVMSTRTEIVNARK